MKTIFDQYADHYDAWYENNKYAYLSEGEALKKVVSQEGKGLEIGVGTGRFAQALEISAGIDPSVNMAEIAKKRGIDVSLGVGEDLPFNAGSFDYIAIIITLCFVKDPEKVLEEACRVLKSHDQRK